MKHVDTNVQTSPILRSSQGIPKNSRTYHLISAGQVEKYTNVATERLELGKALVRASDKAANPKASAKAKAAPKATAGVVKPGTAEA